MPNWKKVVVSGSDAVLNNITASGNIQAVDGVFSGNIFAQQYIVSSSVTFVTQSFSSGSTIFGDSLDDIHRFTGSIEVRNNITASRIALTSSGEYGFGGIGVPDFSTAIKFNEGAFQDQIIFDAKGNGGLFTVDGNFVQNKVMVGNGNDVDFQVRTNNDDSAIYALGSNDNIGIGTNTPTEKLTVSGNISASGDISLGDTITFNTSTTSSTAGTLTNPNIAGRPLVQQGAVNFAGEGITTIGAKARASTSHSIEEGTIVVSGSLGNIGSAASLRTKIPIAKISMLGSSCEWDLQVEIQSTSSAFNPTKIIYPRVGIHLPNSLDATGYFGDSNAGSRSFGPGVFQTATYSTSIANSIGNGEGTDGSILNPSSINEYIDMLGVSIHNLCLHHQGIGSMYPALGSFEGAPLFVKGNSFKSWIKWWVPTSAHTNPNTGAAGEGDFVLGALSIDTGNVGLFENVKTHDSSKVIITMKYKYIN